MSGNRRDAASLPVRSADRPAYPPLPTTSQNPTTSEEGISNRRGLRPRSALPSSAGGIQNPVTVSHSNESRPASLRPSTASSVSRGVALAAADISTVDDEDAQEFIFGLLILLLLFIDSFRNGELEDVLER